MRSTKRRVVVVLAWLAVAVVGAAALTGVAVAAEQSRGAGGSNTASAASAASGSSAGLGPAARLRRLGDRVVHGEATVRTKDGYQVFDTQLGTITSLSATSLTARSSDGFTQTWTLSADTVVRKDGSKVEQSALAVGDTVRLVGPAGTGSASPSAHLVVVRPADSAGPSGSAAS